MINLTYTERTGYSIALDTVEHMLGAFFATSVVSGSQREAVAESVRILRRGLKEAGTKKTEEIRCSKCSCTELEHEVLE